MEIVLKQDDIENLIKHHYPRANEIKFSSKNPKIIIELSSFTPKEDSTRNQVEPKSVTKHEVKAKSLPASPRPEPKKGSMGTERKIVNL